MEDKFSTWEYYKESNPIVISNKEKLIITNIYEFKNLYMVIIIICIVLLGLCTLHYYTSNSVYLITYTIDTNKGREVFSTRYVVKLYKGLPSTEEFIKYLKHLHLGDNIRIIDIHKID